jgi:hypothetical protein
MRWQVQTTDAETGTLISAWSDDDEGFANQVFRRTLGTYRSAGFTLTRESAQRVVAHSGEARRVVELVKKEV